MYGVSVFITGWAAWDSHVKSSFQQKLFPEQYGFLYKIVAVNSHRLGFKSPYLLSCHLKVCARHKASCLFFIWPLQVARECGAALRDFEHFPSVYLKGSSKCVMYLLYLMWVISSIWLRKGLKLPFK